MSLAAVQGTKRRLLARVVRRKRPLAILDLGLGVANLDGSVAQLGDSIVLVNRQPPVTQATGGAPAVRYRSLSEANRAGCSVDLVVSWMALHRFEAPMDVLRSVRAMLKPGGSLIFGDVLLPEDPADAQFATLVQSMRDTEHYRCRSVSEWLFLLEASGLRCVHGEFGYGPGGVPFCDWLRVLETPSAVGRDIRRTLLEDAERSRRVFRVQEADIVNSARNFEIQELFGIFEARPDW